MEIIATETSFATHELDEWYAGEITDAGDGEDYGYGPTFQINILIDGEESDTWALCSPTLTPQTKLWRWIEAIDRTLLPEFGQPLEYKKLIGRRVEIMFEQGKSRVNVGKIRAEKKPVSELQHRQRQAARAKTPVPDDEAPF